MAKLVREKFEASSMSKLGAVLARKSLQELKKVVDPNQHQGAPLLGINGVVIITHGSCTSEGIKNAIHGARTAVDQKLNLHIQENIEKLRDFEASRDEAH